MILAGNVQSVDRVREAFTRFNLVKGRGKRSFYTVLRNEAVGCRRFVRPFSASDASLSRRGNPTADQTVPGG